MAASTKHGLARLHRDAYVPDFLPVFPVLGQERVRVRVYRHRTCGLTESLCQTARVVVVPVTENDGVNRIQVETERSRIAREHETLTSIEQDAVPAAIHPKCKPVLTQRITGDNGVIGENCYRHADTSSQTARIS